MSHLPQTSPNALFGIISDRTGIDQNDIRLLDLVGCCMIATTISVSPTFI